MSRDPRPKRQYPPPPNGLQRVLRILPQLSKLARGTRPHKKQPAGAMDGPAGVKIVAGTGREQPAFRAGNTDVDVSCDAKCDAISPDRVQLLARAVALVAGMAIPEQMRSAVLARVVADLGKHTTPPQEG